MFEDRDTYQQAQLEWEATTLEPALAKSGEPDRNAGFTTISGEPINRLYTALDLAGNAAINDIGFPGHYPYTRGIHPTGYRGKLWTMRMFAGFGTAEETNNRFKYLLAQGQTGLSVAFDMPTLYGRDTDHPLVEGEFGKCGVAISSLADMELLFDGIPIDRVTTSMTINSPAIVIWAMYIAAAEKRGIPIEKLGGTLQNDILKEYAAQNEYIFPVQSSMRLVVDTIEFATRHMPKWNPVSVSGYHIREAGATAAQELAFTLGDGLAYVKATLKRGLNIDDFAPRLSFFFNAHNDFFEEIAKYRAARRIWARQMREVFGAQHERSWWLRFHTQTAGVALTAQQPEINIVRVALQALAGVLGGTQSLHTDGMDEALALPSEKAVTIALRTQQIIAEESGVTNTVDPLGGSYFVEALTDELERQCLHYFEQIEDQGGMEAALERGWVQNEIAEASYRFQREVDNGSRGIVAVNRYATPEPLEIPLLAMDPEGEKKHLARLHQIRVRRDNVVVQQCLQALHAAASGEENLMYPILEAVRAYATLGEICDVLRAVFGIFQEVLVV
ncbi:MAG: methylmalonyl-CoA mutase family protein [Herpetosiphonaceae bacterium]|nr:methylmalonyl-CoA mutase family protein [Herpetosiphonaceae bacterium]